MRLISRVPSGILIINPDLGYGYHTPRFDKYKNEAFFKKYGITKEGEEATINKDKWEMRKELLNISRKAMEDYDERFRNIYQIPQISKGRSGEDGAGRG